MHFENSQTLNEYVSGMCNGEAMLAFSTGKDSIVAWLEMKKYFRRITPIYLYSVPDLEFVERELRYYEDFFKTRIVRLPHPSVYRQLNNLVFQAPENCTIIENAGLPDFDYDDIYSIVRQELALTHDLYAASGVRARDSLNRWAAIKKYGPLNETKQTFFPIFDFTKADMVKALRESKVRLPVDYRMFGRSFDGIDYRFLAPIKEHYPRDYERILAFFPLADLELKRIEYRREYYANSGE